MLVKINLENNSIVVKENGTLEEIALKYFTNVNVKNIEVIEAPEYTNKNEFFNRIPVGIYRADEDEIKEFDLFHNIRVNFFVEYLQGQAENHYQSCGLCRI